MNSASLFVMTELLYGASDPTPSVVSRGFVRVSLICTPRYECELEVDPTYDVEIEAN